MAHTRFSNLTDEELMTELDSRRHQSPVIDELCNRIESGRLLGTETNHKVSCPTCDADLEVDYCAGNDMFNVKPWTS